MSSLARVHRLRVTSALAVTLVLAGVAVGCGDDDDDAGEGSRTDGPSVEVLDAGAEPRRLLELDLAVGDVVHSQMAMEMASRTTVADTELAEVELPAILVDIRTEVLAVDDAEVTVEAEYGSVRVGAGGSDPATAAQVRPLIEQLEGVNFEVTATPNGEVIDAQTSGAENLDPAAASMLSQITEQPAQLSTPLPTEPVGPGARWEIANTFDLGGVDSDIVIAYTLEELSGDEYSLAATYEQTVLPGELPDGAGEIVGGEVSGSGEVQGKLGQMVPVSSELSNSGDIRFEVTADGGDAQEIVQHMEMAVRLAPRD